MENKTIAANGPKSPYLYPKKNIFRVRIRVYVFTTYFSKRFKAQFIVKNGLSPALEKYILMMINPLMLMEMSRKNLI